MRLPALKQIKRQKAKGKKKGSSSPWTPDPGLWTPPHLAERIRAEQAAMEARGITDGERKTITALFADIKGSMDLIEDLDPEEARHIIDPALQLMMDAVHRYEGYVVQVKNLFKILSQRDCLVLETFSVSHGKAYAYLPLIDLLNNYFQIIPQDDERRRREKVGGKVLMLDRSLEDTLPYLFALLGISEPNSPLQQMDPQIRKRRTLEAIKRLLVRESLNQPLMLIEVEYTFKHALTQEVAYNSMLIERRKALHERTAQAIEVLFHSRLEDYYRELAQHYTRSDNTQKAVEYLQLAGQQAVQQSAYAEAISHLTTALELLQTLPNTPERAQQELTLQIALGAPLQVTKGPAAPEAERVYTRARELCRQVGETPQLFLVLRGLWQISMVRVEAWTGRELGEQLLSLAQRTQDPALLLEVHNAQRLSH